MPALHLSEPHTHTPDEAVRRMRDMFDRLRMEHAGRVTDVTEQWNGPAATFSLAASGMRITGCLAVEAKHVVFDLTLPFMAGFFAGAIEAQMREQIRAALA